MSEERRGCEPFLERLVIACSIAWLPVLHFNHSTLIFSPR